MSKSAENIPVMMAVLALSTLPLIIAYVIGQEQLVRGILADFDWFEYLPT